VDTLESAAREAHAWLDMRYESMFAPFYDGRQWFFPGDAALVKSITTNFADPNLYPTDNRGVTYSMAFISLKRLGTGQYYLFAIKDKDGRALRGDRSYRLTVPPKVPVTQYWSVTLYDRATHALIRDQKWASRSSTTPELQKNKDGSVDIYFGPKAPEGKESNWVPTSADGKFEVLFRFYGPEKALFDRSWKLPDIEEVK
jgi:hypothetical protein